MGEGDGLKQLSLSVDLDKVAGRASYAEGGVGGERDVLLDGDGGQLHGFESTTPTREDEKALKRKSLLGVEP